MNQLTLILPFGIPPAALAKDLARQLNMPVFAQILGLSNASPAQHFEEYARLLPHEALLAGLLNFDDREITSQPNVDERLNSPATTHHHMRKMNLTSNLEHSGTWFTLHPVRIHVAHNHLVLTDQRRLAISKEEARTLFESAKTICDEDGYTLVYGDEKTWFLRADQWTDIQTATLDAASGHNMDIWIAKGEHAKAWRKLQNEIQMLWHIHPINEQREERGEAVINSVWLHSGSQGLNEKILNTVSGESALNNILGNPSQSQYLLIDDLSEAAINSDWNEWFSQMQKLETTYFSPILQAHKEKKIGQLTIIASDANRLIQFQLQQGVKWKFWKKPSLKPLFEII